MLAAIPSVVLGLWGILVLGPFVRDHLGPWLARRWFGWIAVLQRHAAAGRDAARPILILAIMIIPITASISRELFSQVPPE